METGHGIKYRQLHIEDYLREIPAEQGRETGEYAHERITGNPDTNTDFRTDNLLDTILRSYNLNAAPWARWRSSLEKGTSRISEIPATIRRSRRIKISVMSRTLFGNINS